MSDLPIWNTIQGNIGSVNEGNIFTYGLSFTNPVAGPLTVEILAGELPPGLTIDQSGLINGTVTPIQILKTYEFTIRLTNLVGIADRSFSIEVTDTAPVWSDASNMGSVKHYSYYEFQYFVTDPGGSVQTFLKIGGELPKGLVLTSSGKLSGLIDLIEVDTTYTFTIRAFLDGNKFEDKTFSLTITILGNRAPLWITPAGLLGSIKGTEFASFDLDAGDPDGSVISYSAVGLPPGYSINSATGEVSGTLPSSTPASYAFSVTASDGFASSSRIFSLDANNIVTFPIIWITPAGSIGNIEEGEKSLLGVKAQSDSPWLRYEVTAGSLPLGLSMDINTGDIWGLAQEQESADTVFNFTVKAYNSTTEEFRNFSVTLKNTYVPGATRVYAKLYGADKLLWYDLFTSTEIGIADPFRQGDDQFGLVEKPKILLVENLDNPTKDQVYLATENVRRTYLTLGKVEVAKAVVNDEIIYEVLYRKVYDDSQGTLEQFTHPEIGDVIKPGSLDNIRNRLLLECGSSGGVDRLPLWMTSEQIIGDATTIPGYTPSIEFAYVKPGLGEDIAKKINAADMQKKKLYLRRVRIDRIVMEPAADSAFEPQYVLFDNVF